ncbi:Rossmann-like domain-containing protein [Corynebacterium kroppenstedtii]|uniref:Rossmann-like domain-containing protein n=1 Tax=Corynebacterium sp. PCR 32 TaxID=3351342 RepID=UPI00309F053B
MTTYSSTYDRATCVDDLCAIVESTGSDVIARSVFYLEHGTRLGADHDDPVYRNRYVVVRIGTSFGACSCEAGRIGPHVADFSGLSAAEILRTAPAEVRMAVIDAVLADQRPHRDDPHGTVITLPTGTPLERAVARDDAIIDLLDPPAGATVALIGVVTPLVDAIIARGATPLLCDRNMDTCLGLPVAHDATDVLTDADIVLSTGMTVSDGSFDQIRTHCLEHTIPLYFYAQSGSAIIRHFLGDGVAGLTAEHFPFSQFSADASPLYVYSSSRSENQ